MEGLGWPADGGKGAKKKQADDGKNKKDTHGTKGKLKDEIKRFSDALRKCLEDCKNPKEEKTPGEKGTGEKAGYGRWSGPRRKSSLQIFPKPSNFPSRQHVLIRRTIEGRL